MKIGDSAEVLDDNISGVIAQIQGDYVVLRTSDDFELQFHKNEVVITKKSLMEDYLDPSAISKIIAEKELTRPKKSIKVKPKERSAPPMEVDLHINQLVKSSKGLSNYDILTIQLETAARQLDFAFRKKVQRIVFIHGVGEGVLKTELEYLFRKYENLKFYDADYQKYGQGATEVYIFQN